MTTATQDISSGKWRHCATKAMCWLDINIRIKRNVYSALEAARRIGAFTVALRDKTLA